MKKILWIGIALTTAIFASNATATGYVSCDSKSGRNMEYGDAPSSYGVACHDTDKWQGLGAGWGIDSDRSGEGRWYYDGDTNAPYNQDNWKRKPKYTTGSTPQSWDKESAKEAEVVGHDDATDDGIAWRTSSDGGVTWSAYGTDNVLTQGDIVEFQFLFSRSIDGNHQFDELKAWLDWDQKNGWDNTQGNDEIITNVIWEKDQNVNDVDVSNVQNSWWKCHYDNDLDYNSDTQTCNSDDDFRIYTQQVEVPLDALTGTTWLRARVTCENSLTSFTPNMVMSPVGYLNQGETEDYMIKIVEKKDPPVGVPEPSNLLIMSPALLLLAGRKRKRK